MTPSPASPTGFLLFRLLPAVLLLVPLSRAQSPSPSVEPPARTFGLVLHGGAGVIVRREMSPQRDEEYRAALTAALQAGYAVLERGGSALDAVTTTINLLEDCPLFNAGRGAVLNAEGRCEMDAAIMDGRTQAAGAVAGLRRIKNPINLARDVMEKSPHVMLAGEGAETFAASLGYPQMPPEYFITDYRRQQWERTRKEKPAPPGKTSALPQSSPRSHRVTEAEHLARQGNYGTVGCVALDRQGNLAAGTSTGGMLNKKWGRVGDVPIIGAGTYARNDTCAVSATGWGEYFIRASVAHDISAQVEYQGKPLAAAAAASLDKVSRLGGDGGVICLNSRGEVVLEFTSLGMYRAYHLSDRPVHVAIYGDEVSR